MTRKFKTNADIQNYIWKDSEEFLWKFNTTDEIFARTWALIEQENDSRLKCKAKQDINRLKRETKHSDIFNGHNTTRQYIREEVKEISKKIFNVLTASSNNKYVIEQIIETFEAKIKPLRGDGDKAFKEADIQQYKEIKKEVLNHLLTLWNNDNISESLQHYKTKWTATLSKEFPTANPDTIWKEIANFISKTIKEDIREYIHQIENINDLKKEFIQTITKIIPTETDNNQSVLEYIESQTNRNEVGDMIMEYIEQKNMEMHKKSEATSIPTIKLSLGLITMLLLQSPLNSENFTIEKEVVMKQLEALDI